MQTNAERLGAVRTDVAVPARPLRYKVQFTADQDYVDLVQDAFDLLGNDRRRPDLPELHLRALRLLVEQLKRRKRATNKEGVVGQAAPVREEPCCTPADAP